MATVWWMLSDAEKQMRKGLLAAEFGLRNPLKELTLLVVGSATQKHMRKIIDEQEIMGALADMLAVLR